MSIWEKIKKLFTKESESISGITQNSLLISIDNSGRPKVSIYLADIDDASCDNFAQLLFNLDSGNYQQPIIEMMLKMSDANPELVTVLEKILIKWGMLMANNSSKIAIKPMIRPTTVFHGSK